MKNACFMQVARAESRGVIAQTVQHVAAGQDRNINVSYIPAAQRLPS